MAAVALTLAAAGCKSSRPLTGEAAVPPLVHAPQQPVIGGPVVNQLPRALAYRMSGNYASNVPVQLDADGNIVSYPAPADVRGQEPVRLAAGWWLDRRGVSDRSVFTTYTYADYQKLTSAPSLAELKAAIIPGARVTRTVALPMSPSEALADTAAVNAFLQKSAPAD